MKTTLTSIALATLLTPAIAFAGPPDPVPGHECKKAQHIQAHGPKESSGIKSVAKLGELDLQKEFPAIGERKMRAREITIEPGGIVAVHQHEQRPGVAYIIEGEIYEHRSDSEQPLLRKSGDTSFEYSGVIHWWENRSDKIVRALIVDIIADK